MSSPDMQPASTGVFSNGLILGNSSVARVLPVAAIAFFAAHALFGG